MSFSFPSHARTGFSITGHNTIVQTGDQVRVEGGDAVGIGLRIDWQDGPLERERNKDGELVAKDPSAVNGAMVEDVLDVVHRRLESYQESSFACGENAAAMGHVQDAMNALDIRRMRRDEAGVEGLHVATEDEGVDQIHPSQQELLGFFGYEHLPAHLQAISRPFHALAHRIAWKHRDSAHGAEVTVALRKLLEAKDAAVRAALP